MFAHALNTDEYSPIRVARSQTRPARSPKGPLNAHQRLVMKAMAVFPGSEIFADVIEISEPQLTEPQDY